jgi:hypothetical protein
VDFEECDLCIVGGGAAGLYLASVLSEEARLKILVLEAGPRRFRDRHETFTVLNQRKVHHGVNEARVTVLGGATNTWGGGLVRASPYDFRPLSGVSGTEWPIEYGELEPHYTKVERGFGIPLMPWGAAKVLVHDADWRAISRDVPILPFGMKNFANHFGERLAGAANVHIVCGAHDWTWALDAVGQQPEIHVRGPGVPQLRIRARQIVLAAGVVGTIVAARSLLTGLRSRYADDCGKAFHDHLSFPIARLQPQSHWDFSRQHSYWFRSGMMWARHYDLESVARVDPGAYLHFTADMSASRPLRLLRKLLYFIQNGRRPADGLPLSEVLALLANAPGIGWMRYVTKRVLLDSQTAIHATLDIEQVPDQSGRLVTDGAASGVTVSWDVSSADADAAVMHVKRSRVLLDALVGTQAVNVDWLLPQGWEDQGVMRSHLRAVAADTFHAAGGLRFARDGDTAVDADLRLRDSPGVSVLSTAVFPRVGTSNPTLTLLALASRLGERLNREL